MFNHLVGRSAKRREKFLLICIKGTPPYCIKDQASRGSAIEFRGTQESDQMPWTPNDAERHTHKATTWILKDLWAKVANECLERTGDEGRAIREANAVIARQEEPNFRS